MDIMSLATELNLMGKFVYNVLYKGKSGREAAMSLLSREQKSE